jgi:hypothetical protein
VSIVKPDIVAVTETWLDDSIADEALNMRGYTLHRTDRNLNGGGVALYIRLSSHYTVSRYDVAGSTFCDYVCVRIRLDSGPTFTVACIYRSTSSTDANNDALHGLIESIDADSGNEMLLTGDFNFPGIDWNDMTVLTGARIYERSFMNYILDHHLTQHVYNNTRLCNNVPSSLLDLFITRSHDAVSDVRVLDPLGNSDHCVIYCKLDMLRNPEPVRTSLRYDRGDYDGWRETLGGVDWEGRLTGLSADGAWLALKNELLLGEAQFVPSARCAEGWREAWMSRTAMTAVRRKEVLFGRWLHYRTDRNHRRYVTARQAAGRACRGAKRGHERDIAACTV